MTEGQNLKLKRRTMAKESQESRRQRNLRRANMGIERRKARLTLSATSGFARTTVALPDQLMTGRRIVFTSEISTDLGDHPNRLA